MRVIFMGTPDFSVETLEALIAAEHDVCLAVTQPDRPKGRGKETQASPVKEKALFHGIPVYQPRRVRDPECVEELRKYHADVIVVVAFGQILPASVLELTPYGCVNVHASLLPKYRGAAPINWAIINGERETGVTTFLLNHEIDKGAILGQIHVPIGEEDTVGTMYEKLMQTGTGLVLDTVERIAAGEIQPVEQQQIDDRTLKPAPKIFKEDCRIDWSQPGRRIVDFIRGLSPYPAAWTALYREGSEEELTAKIFAARFDEAAHTAPCGTVESDGRTFIRVACADGWITLEELQIAGKRRLPVRELLLGWRDVLQYRFQK